MSVCGKVGDPNGSQAFWGGFSTGVGTKLCSASAMKGDGAKATGTKLCLASAMKGDGAKATGTKLCSASAMNGEGANRAVGVTNCLSGCCECCR